MLFQPSNITPSSFAGTGGDLINADNGMTITWQVNGTSPMTAYQIVIYKNDAESTQLYSTGKMTLASPFYGTDGMGNTQFFSASISSSALATAGVVNGDADGYKYKIWQWWGESDYIEQSADNFFIAQEDPVVSINTTSITSPSTPLTGEWAQENGVGLDWVRWIVTLADPVSYLDTGIVVLDSGKLHTQLLQYSYDGWVNGTRYIVKLQYQFQNGYSGSASTSILASWTETAGRGQATAELMPGCADILVRYPIPTYMSLTNPTSVTATVVDGKLIVPAGETLSYSGSITTGQNAYAGIVWSGIPLGPITITFNAVYMTTSGGIYRNEPMTLTLSTNGNLTWTAGESASETGTFSTGADLMYKLVTVIAGAGTWYVVVSELGTVTVNDGEAVLIPNGAASINGTSIPWDIKRISINGNAYDLTQVSGTTVYSFVSPVNGFTLTSDDVNLSLSGNQKCYYFGMTNGTPSGEFLDSLMEGTGEQPEFTSDWLFLSNFAANGYQTLGVMSAIDGTSVVPQSTSIVIYRMESGASVMEKLYAITDFSGVSANTIGQIIDCGAKSGTTYTYTVSYIYTEGELSDSYGMSFVTEAITPCGWDWILTTCQKASDGTYRMTAQYRFGLNAATTDFSNNNNPSLLANFTRYPTRQGVSTNYRTGSLSAYIGNVDITNNIYVDTAAQADAIMEIGSSTDTKFLRSRKGERWMVDTAAATTLKLGDKYKEQPYSASLTWAETGDADGIPVISIPSDAAWPL